MNDLARFNTNARVRGVANLWKMLELLDLWGEAHLGEYKGNYYREPFSSSTEENIAVRRKTMQELRNEFKSRPLMLQAVYGRQSLSLPPDFRATTIHIRGWFVKADEAPIDNVEVSVLAGSRIDAERARESLERELARLSKRPRFAGLTWKSDPVTVSTTDDGPDTSGTAPRGLPRAPVPGKRNWVLRALAFLAAHLWQTIVTIIATVVAATVVAMLGFNG